MYLNIQALPSLLLSFILLRILEYTALLASVSFLVRPLLQSCHNSSEKLVRYYKKLYDNFF